MTSMLGTMTQPSTYPPRFEFTFTKQVNVHNLNLPANALAKPH